MAISNWTGFAASGCRSPRFPTSTACAAGGCCSIYARYDLTFPVDLSRMLVSEFRRRGIDHELAVLPCGHYSTGVTPFKWFDGLTLCRFLARNL